MQLETLSAVQIGDLVNKGEVSPVEVIRYFAQRIDTLNPKVNAFTYTKVDEAIKEVKSEIDDIENYESSIEKPLLTEFKTDVSDLNIYENKYKAIYRSWFSGFDCQLY